MSYRVQQHVFKSELPVSVPKSVRMQAKLVLVALAHFANDDGGSAWPSLATLAEMCACTTRSVTTHLGTLLRAGLIHVESPANQHRPTRYRIEMADTKALSTLNNTRLEMLDAKSRPDTKGLSTECTYENVRTKRSDAFGDLRTFNRAGTVETKSDRASMRETGHAEETFGTDVGADVHDHRGRAQAPTASQPDGREGRDRPDASGERVQLPERGHQPSTRRDSGSDGEAYASGAAGHIAAIRGSFQGRRRADTGPRLRRAGETRRERLFAVAPQPVKAEPHQKDVDKSGNHQYTVSGGCEWR